MAVTMTEQVNTKGSSLCREPRLVWILAPTDLTDASRKAVNHVLSLTKLVHGELSSTFFRAMV
jgi:hypothetical protein